MSDPFYFSYQYDAAGNLTNDLGQTFAYDVTGQQTSASYTGYSLNQSYDGDGLRGSGLNRADHARVTERRHVSLLLQLEAHLIDTAGSIDRKHQGEIDRLAGLALRSGGCGEE